MVQLRNVQFKAMGCPCEVKFTYTDDIDAECIVDICLAEIRRLEAKYSRYLTASVTSQINRAAGRHAISIDQETSALLDYAQACFDQSDGLFDITSGVLRYLWHDELNDVPSSVEIQKYLEKVGWQLVQRSTTSIYLPHHGMEIDFGGIVKEYAVDTIAELMKREGIAHGLVNLGGDIAAIGRMADGKPWEIGISDPARPDQAVARIELGCGAITTSGGYARFIRIGDRQFSHLLSPLTGLPVNNLQSVSVVAPKAIVAGSVCTIALLQDECCALDFLIDSGLPFLAIDKQKKRYGSLVETANA